MAKRFILLLGYFLLAGGGLLAQTVIRQRQYDNRSNSSGPEKDAVPQNNREPDPNSRPAPDPDTTSFVPIEQLPEPINLDEIRRRIGYPSLAKKAGIQGRVIVRVLVGEDGKYRKHVVRKSPHEILTEAVEKELPNLEFTPSMQAGKPVKVWVTIPFEFRLQGGPRPRQESVE